MSILVYSRVGSTGSTSTGTSNSNSKSRNGGYCCYSCCCCNNKNKNKSLLLFTILTKKCRRRLYYYYIVLLLLSLLLLSLLLFYYTGSTGSTGYTGGVSTVMTTMDGLLFLNDDANRSRRSKQRINRIIPQEEEQEGWSNVKLLIYMTTHLPSKHIAFFPCWKDAIQRFIIFKYADLMLYTPIMPTQQQLQLLLPSSSSSSSSSLFPPNNNNIIIKLYNNHGHQSGAIQAMIDPFLLDTTTNTNNTTNNTNQTNNQNTTTWFDDYDWVIRVNPDVLIRNDTWLIQTMLNTSVDMIVHDCFSTTKQKYQLHSDFFAFRPKAVDRIRILQADRNMAEEHISQAFLHIYNLQRYAFVEGAKNAVDGRCRIEGVHSPVIHVHELSKYCPDYYNIKKEGFYR